MASAYVQIMLYSICYVGADYSFRRKDFNRLFCKSTVGVTYTILIATFTANVKSFVSKTAASFASAFAMPTLASARI